MKENDLHAGESGRASYPTGKAENVASDINRLGLLTLSSLREEWHCAFPDRQMPARLSRDLMVRTIAWKMQEDAFGRFPPALARELERLSKQLWKTGALNLERQAIVKPGTTLLREWHGETHRVIAVEDGFLFRDQRFASLTEIASLITGTHWSGPRFFGLRQRPGKPSVAYTDD